MRLFTAGLISLLLVNSVEAKQIGDFNDDGKINILDVVAFLNHVCGKTEIDEIGQDISAVTSTTIKFNNYVLPETIIGSEGKNERITQHNIDKVNEIIIRILFEAWVDARLNLEDNVVGTFGGEYSGTVNFFGCLGNVASTNPLNVVAIFDDYSRDGEMFISGKFNFSSLNTYLMYPPLWVNDDYVYIDGSCRFAVRYKGLVAYRSTVNRKYSGSYYDYDGHYFATVEWPDGGNSGWGRELVPDLSAWEIPAGFPLDWSGNQDVIDSIITAAGMN